MRLVPADISIIEADLAGELAEALQVEIPGDWPPEFHGERTLDFVREALEEPGSEGWWTYYFVEGDTLVGVGGFKGRPDTDGSVEIGFSVVPSQQRRGCATAAAEQLVQLARQRGARTVKATTLPERAASIGVLGKLGFQEAKPLAPGVLAYELALA